MLTILKLGGALLTDKARPDSLRTDLLARIAHEIHQCIASGLINQLIVVHGVGSYGHLPVLRHQLHRGFQSPEQLLPFSHTQSQVMALRRAIVSALQQANIPAVLMLPSSGVTASNFAANEHFFAPVAGFLRIGMIPVLGGDVLADDQVGFSIYGGDAISVDLARYFGADHLLFATDVDGVFTADPRKDETAQRVPQLSLRQMHAVALSGRQWDVSGAMAGKLKAIAQVTEQIEQGMTVRLFSMLQPGQLRAALTNAESGTQITP